MNAKTSAAGSHDPSSLPNIIEAERFIRGLLITFESGEVAFFSADLLHRHLPNADAYDPARTFLRPT